MGNHPENNGGPVSGQPHEDPTTAWRELVERTVAMDASRVIKASGSHVIIYSRPHVRERPRALGTIVRLRLIEDAGEAVSVEPFGWTDSNHPLILADAHRHRMDLHRLMASFGVGLREDDSYTASIAQPSRDFLAVCAAVLRRIKPLLDESEVEPLPPVAPLAAPIPMLVIPETTFSS